jgi:hypothetical protein
MFDMVGNLIVSRAFEGAGSRSQAAVRFRRYCLFVLCRVAGVHVGEGARRTGFPGGTPAAKTALAVALRNRPPKLANFSSANILAHRNMTVYRH